MHKIFSKTLLLIIPVISITTSCKKSETKTADVDVEVLKTQVLSDISVKVCKESYEDMYTKSTNLLTDVNTFNTNPTDANLANCRTLWKDVRNTWEQSEAWLFGPIKADDIDPRIDTWPVNFQDLEGVLNNNQSLTVDYVNNLEDALKGFHPIEYLLWGSNGNKTANTFTDREKNYLVSLTQNLVNLSKSARDTWTNGYAIQLATAGKGSTEFSTQQAAFIQIADAMAGICEEVANSKIKEPFESQDPTKEESPFAKNSIIDFTNNINGVIDIYKGRFINDGKGIEDLVRHYNLSLDAEIKSKHAAAIASLAAFNKPFGESLAEASTVNNAMVKINDLNMVIEQKLKPFIQQYVK